MPTETPYPAQRTALVRFLTSEEGGRATSPTSDVRAQIELGTFQTSCIVQTADHRDTIPLAEELTVTIRILFVEHVAAKFAALSAFDLYDGSRRVASGRFLDA